MQISLSDHQVTVPKAVIKQEDYTTAITVAETFHKA